MARQKNALSLVEFKIYISLKLTSGSPLPKICLVEFKIYISLKLAPMPDYLQESLVEFKIYISLKPICSNL